MDTNQSQSPLELEECMDDRVSVETLKVEINNFLHMHGPREMTLGEAEKVAIKILGLVRPGWQEEESR